MNKLIKILFIFLAITGAVTLISEYSNVPFGYRNFWDYRGHIGGLFFLFFIALFPRLTLIVSSVPFGGLLWWIGWFFLPRILVALLATVSYWNTNKLLVVLAWLVAIGGESSEKYLLGGRRGGRGVPRFSFSFRSNRSGGYSGGYNSRPRSDDSKKIDDPNVIETEFRKL
ncbi:MAG: hypothetical protein HQK49_11895 [Oligoflexia bacterium]|nr:hypothetical protein [Oligoflexia bacterium]